MKQTFILIAAALLLSCAHQMSPGGGPVDKTGPYVVATAPVSGSVKVKPTTAVVLTFSKWITPASALKSVSILPPLDGGFKVGVSARQLTIVPRKRFADSTTYHVVITSALQDFHSNSLTGSFSLVFSTGPALDSGRIAGCVNDTSRRPIQAIAGLYALKGNAAPDSILFVNPDYLTQTNSAGFFSFSNIRTGSYCLVAFVDQNNNRRLDPGLERAFAPLQQTVTVSPLADTFPLYPVLTDTAAPHPISVKALWSGAILCKWSKPLDSLHGFSAPRWAIESADGKSQPPRVHEVIWLAPGDRCILSLDGSLAFAPYRVLASFSRQKAHGNAVINDTLRCNGVAGTDTVKPKFISSLPVRPLSLSSEIVLIFSKPVAAGEPFALTDSLNGKIPLAGAPGYNDTITLSPANHVRPGLQYHLTLMKRSFRDLAGNELKPRDSLSDTVVALTFPVIDGDSLATALKGCAPCLTRDPRRVWRFLPFAGTPASCPDRSGCFEFDSIPSGKGLLEYFIDGNGNKVRDPGSLVPWIPPEPLSRMPDTIEARARWEIEGVTLTQPCSRCAPAPTALTPDTTAAPRPRPPAGPLQKQ